MTDSSFFFVQPTLPCKFVWQKACGKEESFHVEKSDTALFAIGARTWWL